MDDGSFLSQCSQDRWALDNVFSHLQSLLDEPPTFVEFGARDGRLNSNTYYYEAVLNWSGLLIEAGVDDVPALRRNRRCLFGGRPACVHGAVAADDAGVAMHNTACKRGACRTVHNATDGPAGSTPVRRVSLNRALRIRRWALRIRRWGELCWRGASDAHLTWCLCGW